MSPLRKFWDWITCNNKVRVNTFGRPLLQFLREFHSDVDVEYFPGTDYIRRETYRKDERVCGIALFPYGMRDGDLREIYRDDSVT